jgi:hypothetical protein
MNTCNVEVDGCRVTFESLRDLAPAFFQLAETPAFLGFGIFPGMSSGEYKICYEESGERTVIDYQATTATICAPWRSTHKGETLLYAAFPYIELQRQQHGCVTIHAAAVSIGSKAVLILGKEGSGKTTTALGLCRSHGGRLIGNDLVVIGSSGDRNRIVAHGGTKFLSLRFESIQRNMPDLLHLFPNQKEDPWLRKVLVHPPKAGIDLCSEEMPLGGAFLVHVDETKKNVLVKSADTVVSRLYLNENFSRYIRGTCLALLGEKLRYLGYIPSFDSATLFAKRAKLMDRLFTEYSMKYVSGPLGEVVDFIGSESK